MPINLKMETHLERALPPPSPLPKTFPQATPGPGLPSHPKQSKEKWPPRSQQSWLWAGHTLPSCDCIIGDKRGVESYSQLPPALPAGLGGRREGTASQHRHQHFPVPVQQVREAQLLVGVRVRYCCSLADLPCDPEQAWPSLSPDFPRDVTRGPLCPPRTTRGTWGQGRVWRRGRYWEAGGGTRGGGAPCRLFPRGASVLVGGEPRARPADPTLSGLSFPFQLQPALTANPRAGAIGN